MDTLRKKFIRGKPRSKRKKYKWVPRPNLKRDRIIEASMKKDQMHLNVTKKKKKLTVVK